MAFSYSYAAVGTNPFDSYLLALHGQAFGKLHQRDDDIVEAFRSVTAGTGKMRVALVGGAVVGGVWGFGDKTDGTVIDCIQFAE